MLRKRFLLVATSVLLSACSDDTTPGDATSGGATGSGGAGGDPTGGTTGTNTTGTNTTGSNTSGSNTSGSGGSGGDATSSNATGSGGTGGSVPCNGGCAADQVCVEGTCLAVCSDADPCNAGTACHDGACHPIVCGDQVVDEGEQCDLGANNANDAVCTTECKYALCGDGFVWAAQEECDDGPNNAIDAACTNSCHEAVCGDGLIWAGHEECDDGNLMLDDACPDGPGGSCTWVLDPASGLGWVQSSPTNTATPTAKWTPSGSAKLVAQELQLFVDATCTIASGAPVPLAANASSMPVPVGGEGVYSYKIRSQDTDGIQSTSACSTSMVVDMTPPSAATSLGYLETSPHDTLTVHGTWTPSPSPDVATQAIQLYGGSVCTVASGPPVDVGSATANQYPIVTPANATYSFKVITADAAGNTATSTCSPGMQTIAGQPYTAQFGGSLPQYVNQVRIDPKSSSTLYAAIASGQIYKSVDSGANWTLQCMASNIASFGSSYGHVQVSPDGTAYATGHTKFARVEALAGEECPAAFDGSAAWASYFHSTRLGIDSTGKLYTWTFVSPGGLVSSIDDGANYTQINTTESLFNSIGVDPFDDNHILGVFAAHSTDPVGIQHSLDAGVTWTQTDATFEEYQGGVLFNPAVEGWIYLEGGHYSQDGGLTWATNAAFDVLEVDASGAGYRLVTSANGVQLRRAPNMTNPIWSTLHTFTGIDADFGRSMVSVVGSTIAVVLQGKLFISTNAGTTFTAKELAVTNGPLVASSIVAHGSVLYAAANGRIFGSTDAAQTWHGVYAPADALDPSTELHLNPGVPEQLIARPESWNSTYQERLDVTVDGGVSWVNPTDCCYGWAGVLALGPADPSRVYYFGWEPRVSYDGGFSFTPSDSSGPLVWDPWPQAFVSPGNSNIAWYGDDYGDLIEYDLVGNDETDITNRLPFSNPAGMDMALVGGVWQLRVISPTGEIAISQDNGLTFTLVPGSGGLPAQGRRIFVHHPGTPELIATAPLLGGEVAYSPTIGKSWVKATLDSCAIRGLALTDEELFIPCEGSPAMAIKSP